VNADGTDEQALFNDGKDAVPDWIAGS